MCGAEHRVGTHWIPDYLLENRQCLQEGGRDEIDWVYYYRAVSVLVVLNLEVWLQEGGRDETGWVYYHREASVLAILNLEVRALLSSDATKMLAVVVAELHPSLASFPLEEAQGEPIYSNQGD